MRAIHRSLLFLLAGLAAWNVVEIRVLADPASSTRLIKVLPQFIDKQGRVALNPSLYERDAYQAHLRATPAERGGLRFAVQWTSKKAVQLRLRTELRLRMELRGTRGKDGTTALLGQPVRYKGLFSAWSILLLASPDYEKFGELSAWRATLWDGEKLIAEQTSFLW